MPPPATVAGLPSGGPGNPIELRHQPHAGDVSDIRWTCSDAAVRSQAEAEAIASGRTARQS